MYNQLTEQLTESQKKAVFHKDGPLLILAGPGSGKTRVITHRVVALIEEGVRPYNICAITFTNKAAEEMRQRAYALGAPSGVLLSTFHSLCVRILRQYSLQANLKPNFSIYDASDQKRCIKQALKDCQFDTANFAPSKMAAAISTLKNNTENIEEFAENADSYFSKVLAKVYKCYQHILAERNALDFDDLLMRTALLLEKDSQVRTEISNRYKYILVDEYQDTNQAQYKIAKLMASTHNNICATGDPDQSIYRWRGADIRNILAFESDYPDAAVIKLEENFRSTPNILEAADKLIAVNQNRKEKTLIATRPPGTQIISANYEDERKEAEAVANEIAKLTCKGIDPRQIAVFYRVNSMSRVLEEALIKSQIPYQIVRGVEFYGRKEIRDVLAYLKILVNPEDQVALLRVINTPARGIGKTTIDRVKAYAVQNHSILWDTLKKASQIDTLPNAPKAKIAMFVNMIEQFKKTADGPVAALIENVFDKSGLKNFFQAAQVPDKNEIENVNELINAAGKFDKESENPTLIDYLQQISLFSDADAYDSSNRQVALMTLHASKGLEFDNVFIIGLEEGLLPHERSSDDQDQMEEERRLFFVGITRTKSRLHISYARYRTVYGQMIRTIPSPFLFEAGLMHEPQLSEHTIVYEPFDDYSRTEYKTEPPFKKNQLVEHKKFGLGRVQQFTDLGENSTVDIKFNSGQTKTLVLKYANLLKVNN